MSHERVEHVEVLRHGRVGLEVHLPPQLRRRRVREQGVAKERVRRQRDPVVLDGGGGVDRRTSCPST